MLVARNWKDYEVLDATGAERLERWGDFILLRPDPQVIWDTPKKAPEWEYINAHYHRSNKGGGSWEFFDLPDVWSIKYDLGGQSEVKKARSGIADKSEAEGIPPSIANQPEAEGIPPSIANQPEAEGIPQNIANQSEAEGIPQNIARQPGSSEPAEGLRLTFNLKPMNFKHTGLFPEQAVNWEWFSKIIRDRKNHKKIKYREASKEYSARGTFFAKAKWSYPKEIAAEAQIKKGAEIEGIPHDADAIKVLNLFAYTGAATIAAAKSGAHVTHVDSAAGMVKWAKENAAASGVPFENTRWIIDDCAKFVDREIRRGNKYDAIIMDPPSYGRGPKGEIWKMEDDIFGFIKKCAELLSDKALFFLINSYTTGLQSAVLTYMLSEVLIPRFGGSVFSDEIGLPVSASGLILPAGACGRWELTRSAVNRNL